MTAIPTDAIRPAGEAVVAREWSLCRVLLLEDNPDDQILIERCLREIPGVQFTIQATSRVADAGSALMEGTFDVILCDMRLPDGTALDLLEGESSDVPPVVVLTGLVDEESAIRTVSAGAQDYLFKTELQPRHLWNAIRYSILRHDLAAQSEQLRKQELALKDQVLSHVSHELRTPLSAVLQFASILAEEIAGPLSDKQREYLEIIQRNAVQLKRLIGDLMDVARINSNKFTLHSRLITVAELVQNATAACADIAAERGVTLQVNPVEDAPPVLADPDRIHQVLLNLIGNGIKFSPRDSEILIQATSTDDCGVARIEVRDNGPGIPEEEQDAIFDRLGQANQNTNASRKGLGLGLYIAREIVERSGGDIGVHSTESQGSTFWFTLPNYTLTCTVCRAGAKDPAGPALSLLSVDVLPEAGSSPARGINDAVMEAARTLEGCLQPCNDTVLPEHRPLAEGARLFAIVRSEPATLNRIINRVQSQLAASGCRLGRWRYRTECSAEPVPLGKDDGTNFLEASKWIQAKLDGTC